MVIKILTSGKRHYVWVSSFPLVLLIFSIIIFVPGVISDGEDVKEVNVTSMERLRLQLFTNYDKNAHPFYNGEPSNVTLGMSVNYIDIDEMNGKMTLHAWLRIRWLDSNRSWNSQEYENITQMHLKPREIWKPDVTLFNSAGNDADYLGDTQVLLWRDGSFLWVPPAVYSTYCYMNFRLWPYDRQTCNVKIGSWAMTDIDPHYLKLKEVLDVSEMVESTEWEITSSNVQYHKKDYFNYVEFTFELKRQSSMYTAVIFTPASCIIILALSTFWLPPQMGEKILLNGIIIVIISAFLMYFAQLLPILAENTPLVVLFYSASLIILSISTIIAVLVLYLSTARHNRRLPECIRRLLNSKFGDLLCLTHFSLESEPQSLVNNGTKEMYDQVYEYGNNEAGDPSEMNPPAPPTKRSMQFDWILLATAVDRISFLAFSIIFLVMAIVYSV